MKQVLSIQSHVAYGHVGNAAAVFPLQRLGIEVWPVMTVQFSNHPGYGEFSGDVLPESHIAGIIGGMAKLGVLGGCDAVLTGYLGAPGMGAAALDAVAQVKAQNPAAIYACDPVMGDAQGGLFVAEEIPAFMAERALPAADLLTPNAFELEVLTGGRIGTIEDAVTLARRVIAKGPQAVLVTSLTHGNSRYGTVEVLCVTREEAWRVVTPLLKLDPMPNGAGDALAALFLGHLLQAGSTRDTLAGAAPEAMEAAVAGIFAIMEATAEQGGRELALVAAAEAMMAPRRRFAAEAI